MKNILIYIIPSVVTTLAVIIGYSLWQMRVMVIQDHGTLVQIVDLINKNNPAPAK